MRYADYSFYSGSYRGRLSREDFDALITGASAILDEVTFGRIPPENITQDIRLAACAMADKLHKTETPLVSTERAGNLSVSYRQGASEDIGLARLAARYIRDKSLFYRGCS